VTQGETAFIQKGKTTLSEIIAHFGPPQKYEIHDDRTCPGFMDTGLFWFEESTIGKTRPAYPPEFRRQMVELLCANRSQEKLAHELEPTAQSIRNWSAQSKRNAGRAAA
jgi:hypothetical protein